MQYKQVSGRQGVSRAQSFPVVNWSKVAQSRGQEGPGTGACGVIAQLSVVVNGAEAGWGVWVQGALFLPSVNLNGVRGRRKGRVWNSVSVPCQLSVNLTRWCTLSKAMRHYGVSWSCTQWDDRRKALWLRSLSTGTHRCREGPHFRTQAPSKGPPPDDVPLEHFSKWEDLETSPPSWRGSRASVHLRGQRLSPIF